MKIRYDCVLWSVYRKCGVGVNALLEVMVDVNKSIELSDCSLIIQDGNHNGRCQYRCCVALVGCGEWRVSLYYLCFL